MFSSVNQIAVPFPGTPYHHSEDGSNYSSISSATVFLHDGVLRSISVKGLKDFESRTKFQDALTLSSVNQMEELITIGLATNAASNTSDLSKKILQLSTLHVQSVGLHHRYQWHVLEKAWRHQHQKSQEKEKSQSPQEDNRVSQEKPQGQFGFKLSLCLLVPMIEMFATSHSPVAISSLQLILDELSPVPVASLRNDTSISLDKLENLLLQWASNSDPAYQTSGPAAMIAVVCARGTVSSFAKTILMLENLTAPLRSLPVAGILRKLNNSRNAIAKPCAIHSDKHVISWPYDDRLSLLAFQAGVPLGTMVHPTLISAMEQEEPGPSTAQILRLQPPSTSPRSPTTTTATTSNRTSSPAQSSNYQEELHRHFVATDGKFLFCTGPDGNGLSKVGTGVGGTLQAWVYHCDIHLSCGFLAFSNDILISRPLDLDDRKVSGHHIIGVTIDPLTLKPEKVIILEKTPDTEEFFQKPVLTLGMTSDGQFLYLIRAELPPLSPTPHSGRDATPGQLETPPNSPVISVFLDILQVTQDPEATYAIAKPKYLHIPLIYSPNDPEKVSGSAPPAPPSEDLRPTNDTVVSTVRRSRSVRMSAQGPPPPPPPPPPAAPGSLESLITSLNLSVKQLQSSFYFTCGNFLTIVTGTSIHYLSASGLNLGPSLTAAMSITNRQYCPVMSSTCSKTIGTQLHFNLSNLSPETSRTHLPASRQDFINGNPDSSFFHGALIPEVAATYDPVNNLIWTCNGVYADSWRNSGHIPPWKMSQLLPFPNSTNQDISVFPKGSGAGNADVKTVINCLLRHIGIMANHFNTGDKQDANIGFDEMLPSTQESSSQSFAEEEATTGSVLKTLINLVLKYRGHFEGPELTSIILALRAIASQVKAPLEADSELYKDLYDVQVMILCLLNDPGAVKKFQTSPSVYHEACNLFSVAFDLLYTSPKSRDDFFQELYDILEGHHTFHGDVEGPSCSKSCQVSTSGFVSPTKCLTLLEEKVLQRFSESLSNPGVNFEEGLKWVVETPWLNKIIQRGCDSVKEILVRVANQGFPVEGVIRVTSSAPTVSVSTKYVNAVVNFLLRSLVLSPPSPPQSTSSTSSNEIRKVVDLAIEVFRDVLKGGPMIVELCLEYLSASENHIHLGVYNCIEAIVKSSLLAHGIPQILGFLSLENLPTNVRPILEELTEECILLTVAMSFLAKKLNPGDHPHKASGDDWSSKVKVFSPWNTKRFFESMHPARDGYKSHDTIVIPNALQLYMKLSPQCATQYDYDRLSFLTSPLPADTPAPAATPPPVPPRRILEFGGNYYGYGNRFFSGPGWARDTVKLCEGDTISFHFEPKSGREHAIPDKALWGYHFMVFPMMDYSDELKPPRSLEDTESLSPISTGFTTLTALHCVDVIKNVAKVLLEGSGPTSEEKATSILLENRLVASLKWPSNKSIKKEGIPRKFSQEVIQKVKRAVGVSPLQMRLSIIEKMRAAELEELYLQCCLHHIGTNPYLTSETILSPICESCWSLEPTRDILREMFQNVDTLFRKIMALYEMEKMFSQEIEEISSHSKDFNDAFFTDPSFLENPGELQTLAWICYLDYDKDNPGNLVNDVIAMVTALSADGKKPELTRTDELIEETHDKCKYLLSAVPSPQTIFIGPVYPSQATVIERIHNVHAFISAHLTKREASVTTFIDAMRCRRERAGDRIKGLDILQKVLECSSPNSCLLMVAAALLQQGPRLHNILCSGLEKEVIRIFGEVMKIAVGIAEKNPLLHRYSVAILSVTAYDGTDEENLVESGLVGVLDQLCAYQTGYLTPLYNRSSPTEVNTKSFDEISAEVALTHHKASTLAWAAFQVLASQCASWEQRRSKSSPLPDSNHFWTSDWDEPEHRELAYQISINVTNHLARAAALAALSSTPGLELTGFPEKQHQSSNLSIAIQDVLDLLSNLRTYKIGRAILKQSPCICRLLGLLQDSRLSPRLVLTILKLLHTALPLVDSLDTAHFKQIVPIRNAPGKGTKFGGQSVPMTSFWSVMDSTPYTQVASMLLSKLADYLVCGSQTSSVKPPPVPPTSCQLQSSGVPFLIIPGLTDARFDRMEVWVHKTATDQQHTQTLVRQLFVDHAQTDLRPTRGTMHQLEAEMNNTGKVLLYCEDSFTAERKAMRISQMGHITTLIPAGWSLSPGIRSGGLAAASTAGHSPETICKDRNDNLIAWDPSRPFLSGHVSENLASEIVQLVRALLAPSNLTGKDTSGCGSRGNIHQSGSSTTSLAGGPSPSVCTGIDAESLASETSRQLAIQKTPSQWPGAVEQVICAALKLLPRLLSVQSPAASVQLDSYVYSARLIVSALTVLGGFTETIRAGLEVWIVEQDTKREATSFLDFSLEDQDKEKVEDFWEFVATKAKVISVSDTSPTAKVEIITVPESTNKNGHNASSSTKQESQISKPLAVSDTLVVPTCRLVPAHWTRCGVPNLPELSRSAQIEVAGFLKAILLPSTSTNSSASSGTSKTLNQDYPLKRGLPTLQQIVSSANSSGNSPGTSESRHIAQAMTIVRLNAEIRTKSMQVLSLWLRRKEFCDVFIGIGSNHQFLTKKFSSDVLECTQNLKDLSKQCVPSHKAGSLEKQVAYMRLVYRDCTRPPRLPISTDKGPFDSDGVQPMRWDLSRQFPRIRSLVFSSALNSLVYNGDYNVTGGNPRGLVLYGSGPITSTGFYWEATIVTMEEPGQHADLIVIPPLSIGLAPVTSSSSNAPGNDLWKYTSGTVMYTTLGRVVQYKTQDPGTWVTIRLDDAEMMKVKAGDTVGIGWEKNSGQRQGFTSGRNQSASLIDTIAGSRRHRGRGQRSMLNQLAQDTTGQRGNVYFTLNGRRLNQVVEQVNSSLHPILHIQKRQMVVHTNFGERPFVYHEANKNTEAFRSTPTAGPSTSSGHGPVIRPNVITTEAGTSNQGSVLLRRVSDSLQDLNLVFNLNLNEMDSEQELNQIRRPGSASAIAGASNYSADIPDDNPDPGGILDVDEVDDDEDNSDAEDWEGIQIDDDDDDDGDGDDDDDDDDDDEGPDMIPVPQYPTQNQGLRLLPPSPASGASSSMLTLRGSRRRPPPKNGHKRRLRKANTSLDNSAGAWDVSGGIRKNEVVAKGPQKSTEYNPVQSLDYFLGHSPTTGIRVFQGPRRYACPCQTHIPTALDFLLLDGKGQDNNGGTDRSEFDFLDNYEDEDDDIHSLLVRAWEQQVFPIIRRRFRNESERRDGLDQIRGALQLGMIDIARQTVEFLYEEGGGIPRDLHFPTLEEVRAEAARCTLEKLKPGMNVVIRGLQQDIGLLPIFAVPGMLRTFGLIGEVLEVDAQNELVLVETYIESEGVLVRFWYPVSALDKSTSSNKPTLSTTTVNMFKLYSNLISMEGSLCRLYSRQCYLSICHECNLRSVSAVIPGSPAAITQISIEFDLDSLQILSDNCLSKFPPSRDLFTYNLQCESPSLRFLQDPGNPSTFFYRSDQDHAILGENLRQKITQALNTAAPEESLDKLTHSLLGFLENPEKFPKHEVPLSRITDLEVVFPGAAFTLVSFKGPQLNKQMSAIDNTAHPCLHVCAYDSSEMTRHLMGCYPLEPLSVVMHRASTAEDGSSIISHTAPTTASAANSSAAAMNKTLRKRHARFPPVLCPTERVHCSISEATLPDIITDLQGIPKEFPLAIVYLQEMVRACHSSSQEMVRPSFTNVTTAITYLLDFIDSIHMTPVIKDWIFTMIAELSRVRSQTDRNWKPNPTDKVAKSSTPNRLFLELLLLRDKEVADVTQPLHIAAIISAIAEHIELPANSRGNKFAPASLMFHISNFILSQQKSTKTGTEPNFSFYFNSLNDLCLALNEISELIVNPYDIIPCASTDPSPMTSPQRRPSTTESISLIPGGPVGVNNQGKRVLAKARRRPFTSNGEIRKMVQQQQQKMDAISTKAKAGQQGSSSGVSPNPGDPKGKKVIPTSSEIGLLTFTKASEVDWFNNQVIITRVLRDIVWHSPNDPQCVEAGKVLIGTILDKLKTPTVHNRLLVIAGAPVDIDGMSIEASLIKALRGCGGIHGNKMWISGNSAVVEIRAIAKVNEAYETLKQNRVWYPLEDYILYPPVSVFKVDMHLHAFMTPASLNGATTSSEEESRIGDEVLAKFFRSKISDPEAPDLLSSKVIQVLSTIFTSCYGTTIPFVLQDESEAEEEEEATEKGSTKAIILTEDQLSFKVHGNLMELFTSALKSSPRTGDPENFLKEVLSKFGENMGRSCSHLPKAESDGETKDECGQIRLQSTSHEGMKDKPSSHASLSSKMETGLSLRGFLHWCTELLRDDPQVLWEGLLSSGYDLRLDRIWLSEDPQVIYGYFHSSDTWSQGKDAALISYVDQFSQSLHIDPTRIQPPELSLTESDFLNPSFAVLQGVGITYLRVRWGMFQKMNTIVSKKLLAQGYLHSVKSTRRSLANLLHASRQFLLYYIKDAYLYKIIYVSAARGGDTPTPEITIDPVSSIGSQDDTIFKKQLSQIIQQMSTITTAFYCVPPAQGSDPALPLSVKFQGEEVPGLSGSFRHFLLNAVKELQSETVKLLCRCPSADAGQNKDSFIITPGKLSYGEEDFLYFLGQLIGISIRSDSPLPLPLLKVTWRSVLLTEKEYNDHLDDLMEADVLCATYLKKLDSLTTKMAFDNFLSLNAWPKFQYPSMGDMSAVPLCQDGSSMHLTFGNRDQFVKLVKQFRQKEIRCSNKVTKILAGLSTIIPLPAILALFTTDHLELRISGSPEVNLSLLKSHTHYQVGVSENDPHIMYFWAALESFTPDELKKFIKFSCNLERLPITCPCQAHDHFSSNHQLSSASSSVVHVPPFPMKIAPIDIPPNATVHEIDKRLIRVETCMFLIRLPPYSSLQTTRQQLLFAINCRDDPLSG